MHAARQVLDYLEDNLRAEAASLGDAHKESPEELAERHERVQAASLAALGRLLEALLPPDQAPPGGNAPAAPGARAAACCCCCCIFGAGCCRGLGPAVPGLASHAVFPAHLRGCSTGLGAWRSCSLDLCPVLVSVYWSFSWHTQDSLRSCSMLRWWLGVLWVLPDEAAGEALRRVRGLLLEPGALKRLISAKSPLPVRTATYRLIALLSRRRVSLSLPQQADVLHAKDRGLLLPRNSPRLPWVASCTVS